MTAQTEDAIAQAVEVLGRGDLVAFPTETVYGLGADASDVNAIDKIYAAKGRPSNHPVIVHVAYPEDMRLWAQDIPELAFVLARAFWPGPLTLILKRADSIPAAVSGGQDTIGIRCPSHPVARALLQAFAQSRPGLPAGIAAPSANRFGHVSPSCAQHVRDEFPELVAAGMPVLEGGNSEVGIESTIVDLSRVGAGVSPALLRPGGLSAASIETVLGCPLIAADTQAPRVSGSLKAHYSPETTMRLCPQDRTAMVVGDWLGKHSGRLAVVGTAPDLDRFANNPRVCLKRLLPDPVAYAHKLYATLREVDAAGVDAVVWERVPQGPDWDGVRDRLERAAAAFDGDSANWRI
jgi:L-threonylcarbamoyladenylate synthase